MTTFDINNLDGKNYINKNSPTSASASNSLEEYNDFPSTSTVIYDNMTSIYPLQISTNIWIGPLSFVDSINAKYILNLTSSLIMDQNNEYNIINMPMSSKNFQSFLKIVPIAINFIDNAKLNNIKSYICCRNGYSRALVIISIYKIYHGKDSYINLINKFRSFGLIISEPYCNFLRSFENIIKNYNKVHHSVNNSVNNNNFIRNISNESYINNIKLNSNTFLKETSV